MNDRLVQAVVELEAARNALRKAEKDKGPTELERELVQLAEANVVQAEAAAYAMKRFPPR